MTQAIVQFGTSRFLLAHAALFVSDALAGRDGAGAPLGGITLVQTTDNPASAARVLALAQGQGYPVRIRGLKDGTRVDETVQCMAVREALRTTRPEDWRSLRAGMASGDVQVIMSNTADRGYVLDEQDSAAALADDAPAPASFPTKLLVLLQDRWRHAPDALLSLLPCELIERNGDVLRDLVCRQAESWGMPAAFVSWLRSHCVWANSLVDRIVSEAIDPVGAVAEPYALWAIEAQPRLVPPCAHPAIIVTDDLAHYAQRKLFLLNAAHTYLAHRWQQDGRPAGETVRAAMDDPALSADLDAVWAEEILPVFGAPGSADRQAAERYVAEVRERFCNPFLQHAIRDIAQNHADKIQRRIVPILDLASTQGLALPHSRLRSLLA